MCGSSFYLKAQIVICVIIYLLLFIEASYLVISHIIIMPPIRVLLLPFYQISFYKPGHTTVLIYDFILTKPYTSLILKYLLCVSLFRSNLTQDIQMGNRGCDNITEDGV